MMRKILKLMLPWIIILILLASIPVFSEETEMTLEEARNTALKENPDMVKSSSSIREADRGITEARGYLVPWLDGGAEYTRYGRENIVDLSFLGLPPLESQSQNNWKAYISLSQTLFNYGLWTNYDIAKLNLINAEYGYDITKQNVLFEVDKSYYGVLQANSFKELSVETVEQYEVHLKDTEKQYKQGVVPKYDILRVEVELAQSKEDLVTANNNVDLSLAGFNKSMGISLESPVNIKESLKYELWDIEYEDCLSYAMKNRPDLQQMDTLIEIADENITYARSEHYPTVDLSAVYYTQNENAFQVPNDWYIKVSASVPIFHGYSITAKVEKAEEQLFQVEQDRELLRQQAELEVKQAYLNLKSSLEKIDVTSRSVILAEESMRMANVRYEGGVASISEVIDTQVALTQAKTNYINAVYDYDIARVTLEKAMGMLVDFGYDQPVEREEVQDRVEGEEIVSQTETEEKKSGIIPGDVILIADRYGNTPEEKYGNAIYGAGLFNRGIMLALVGLFLDKTDEGEYTVRDEGINTPEDMSQEEFKEMLRISMEALEDMKKAMENIEVPEGYEELNKKYLDAYDGILEGLEMGQDLSGVEGEFNEEEEQKYEVLKLKIDEGVEIHRSVFVEITEKGYVPSMEFEDALEALREKAGGENPDL